MIDIGKEIDKGFLLVVLLMIAATLGITAYSFLYVRAHDFIVEAPCDTASETCFYRDCSEEDACPPNELEDYRVFKVTAADFAQCTYNSCLEECTSGTISCEEIMCGMSEDDACSIPHETEIVPEEEPEVKE